jgi:hypothetical protein
MTNSDALMRQATFVFRGTVKRLGATATGEVEATPRTAVVGVDEVIRAPAPFADLAGQDVTLRLRAPESLREQQQAVFFATSWLFGDGVALEELDHAPADEAPSLASRSETLAAQVADERLQDRLARAEAVVAGRVSNVRPSVAAAASAAGPAPASEHDPNWYEAVIDVDTVLKGSVPPGPVVVLFPWSLDVYWHDAPKFHAGQEGVWLLHSQQVPQAVAEQFPLVFTALDPMDFRPLDVVGQVRSLLQRP